MTQTIAAAPHRLLPLADARARVLEALAPVAAVERVPLRRALGRVLGEDVIARAPVPAHASSAMDGYALRGADLPASGTRRLRLIGRSYAGHPFAGVVGAGECVRIMTGAVIPQGADTVVLQEDANVADDGVEIGGAHAAGQNVRAAGEDLAAGERALASGHRVGAADLGLMASLGCVEVAVRRRLRVAYFSTGDELRSLGEPLGAGDVYDSNRYTLYAMLVRCGVEPLDLGVVRDEPAALRAAFAAAGSMADAVITSGGVSVGAADHVRTVLAELGEIRFWKVNIKPGKPFAFGRLAEGPWFFGLPGNPVAAMVTFYQLVQPALEHLAGAEPRPRLSLAVPTRVPLHKRGSRREFQRGRLEVGADGAWGVRPTGPQGSGILHSMSLANCFIVLPEDARVIEAGAPVTVEPFAGLV